jgi:hypothetical protein
VAFHQAFLALKETPSIAGSSGSIQIRDAIESLLAKIRFEFYGRSPRRRRDWVFDVNGSLK